MTTLSHASSGSATNGRSREVTHHKVMQYARHARVFSRAQVADELGLSPSTVTHVVRRLLAEGYLAEAGTAKSSGGRPQAMLEFQAATELVAVVDIRRGRIETLLADWYGTVIHRSVSERRGGPVDDVERSVRDAAHGEGVDIRALCVAIPGVASEGGQVRLAPAVGLHDGQPLGEQLRSRLRIPVVVDNDVNLTVVGEHVAGAGKDAEDISLVHIGESGIGCGLMIGGKVRQGASGVAGEIGFLPLGDPRPPQNGVGAFESRWCGEAIATAAGRLGLCTGDDDVPLRKVQEAASTDASARALLDGVLAAWSGAVVSTICVIDPELVLLSGAATDLSPESTAALLAMVAEYAPGTTSVRTASLGEGALLEGAVRRAFNAYDAAALA